MKNLFFCVFFEILLKVHKLQNAKLLIVLNLSIFSCMGWPIFVCFGYRVEIKLCVLWIGMLFFDETKVGTDEFVFGLLIFVLQGNSDNLPVLDTSSYSKFIENIRTNIYTFFNVGVSGCTGYLHVLLLLKY